MTDLPSPLTPADCNLQDFQFMPIDVHRLLTSETWVLGNGEEKAAAITLWLASWHQIPAGSIPNSPKMLAHLSQSGSKWSRVKLHALRGWVQASDGRLYHPVVAEKVLEAWIEKLANSLSGATGNAKRWGVVIETDLTRAKFTEAVTMLRAVAPQSKTLKKKIVATIGVESPPESPPDLFPASPPESPGDRKGQGQGQGQGLLTSKAMSGGSSDSESDDDRLPPRPTLTDIKPDGRAVGIATLLTGAGVKRVTAFHPDVAVTWAQDERVTDTLLLAAVARAKETLGDEPFQCAYLRPIIAELLNPPAPRPAKPTGDDWTWRKSNGGIDAKGRELGMFARSGESYPDFANRIQQAIDKRKGQQP